jgi:hypothetical protein
VGFIVGPVAPVTLGGSSLPQPAKRALQQRLMRIKLRPAMLPIISLATYKCAERFFPTINIDFSDNCIEMSS